MHADLDDLLTALFVLVDDLLPSRRRVGRPARISASELITLAVAQVLLDCHSERRFLRLARKQLGHLFPYIPLQPGYNKRLRALAPQICEVIEHLARISPSFCDRLRLLDSTPVPCGQSRETRKRSELAGWAAYGYCASHSRPFWGLRLYLLCAPDGMPVSFCLAPANEGEREVAAAMLDRARERGMLDGGEIIVTDKGFASREFEQLITSLDATLIRPDRKDEHPRFGNLGRATVAQLDQQLDDAKAQAHELQHTAREAEDEWTAARSTATMVDQARVQQARELIERRQQLVRLERQVAQLAAKRTEGLGRREYKREVEQATEQLAASRQQHYRAERSFADSEEWRPNSPIYGVQDPSQVIEMANAAAAAAAERQKLAQAATARARSARRRIEQLTQRRKTARQTAAHTWGEWVKASRELAIEEYRQQPTAENLAEAARIEILTRPPWAQREVAGTGKTADALRQELAAARISAGITDPDAPSAEILADELRHRITQHQDELAKQPSHEPPRARTHTNDQGQDGGIDR